jgi:hypothetical protein
LTISNSAWLEEDDFQQIVQVLEAAAKLALSGKRREYASMY